MRYAPVNWNSNVAGSAVPPVYVAPIYVKLKAWAVAGRTRHVTHASVAHEVRGVYVGLRPVRESP